jgi:large subunit ribosomal protein L16
MLIPAKTKYRKAQKGGKKILGVASNGNSLKFGAYGLKALEPSKLNSKQIESARKVITRYMKRAGKLWIRIFPDIPVSKKPADVRMGKGKGSPEFWACRVKPGRILFELDSVTEEQAMEAFARAAAKLPIKTKVIRNIEEGV